MLRYTKDGIGKNIRVIFDSYTDDLGDGCDCLTYPAEILTIFELEKIRAGETIMSSWLMRNRSSILWPDGRHVLTERKR